MIDHDSTDQVSFVISLRVTLYNIILYRMSVSPSHTNLFLLQLIQSPILFCPHHTPSSSYTPPLSHYLLLFPPSPNPIPFFLIPSHPFLSNPIPQGRVMSTSRGDLLAADTARRGLIRFGRPLIGEVPLSCITFSSISV